MQNPVTSYLDTLRETRRSELTIKAARQTLQSFQAWWETGSDDHRNGTH